MLFPTFSFIFLFLPIVLFLYWLIGFKYQRTSLVNILLISSLTFYLLPNYAHGHIIISSIFINYFCADRIQKTQSAHSKKWLLIGVVYNLLVILYYKYSFFFGEILTEVTELNLGFEKHLLPVGISFYTFQQIAFLVDAYRKKDAKYKITDYALFVSFFPQLIAGPIVHHKELVPQLAKLSRRPYSWKCFNIGLVIFSLAVFKKLVIADNFADIANPIFALSNQSNALDAVTAWMGAMAYTLQLYFDFSAYSEMAIGLGLLFGVKLPINFLSPYQATSIIDFWRRWHITLSTFLRDYLYIPLGGNRNGKIRKYTNLMLTMLLGGLWHGAGWGFIIWGGLHGLYLIINHIGRYLNVGQKMPSSFNMVLTTFFVLLAWVFFRAENLTSAVNMLSSMFGQTTKQFDSSIKLVSQFDYLIVFIGFIWVWWVPNLCSVFNYKGTNTSNVELANKVIPWLQETKGAVIFGTILALTLTFMPEPTVFIYFNF